MSQESLEQLMKLMGDYPVSLIRGSGTCECCSWAWREIERLKGCLAEKDALIESLKRTQPPDFGLRLLNPEVLAQPKKGCGCGCLNAPPRTAISCSCCISEDNMIDWDFDKQLCDACLALMEKYARQGRTFINTGDELCKRCSRRSTTGRRESMTH